MSKRIRPTEKTAKLLRDTGPTLPRLDADTIAAALGAEAAVERIEEALAPVTLLAMRAELVARLQSSGGRPALSGTTRRAKIPLGDEEWQALEDLAAAISSEGFTPSAGQVASVLLTLAVRSVAAQVASTEASET
jgi:hypothetical protein